MFKGAYKKVKIIVFIFLGTKMLLHEGQSDNGKVKITFYFGQKNRNYKLI